MIGLKCRVTKVPNKGYEVTNSKGKPSKLFEALKEKYNEEKAVDIIEIVSSDEAFGALSSQINSEGEVSMEVAENYITAFNSSELGKLRAIDIVMLQDVMIKLDQKGSDTTLTRLESIVETGKIPYSLSDYSLAELIELTYKLRNEEVSKYLEIPSDGVFTEEGYRDTQEVLDKELLGVTDRAEFDSIVGEYASETFTERYTSDKAFADKYFNDMTDKTIVTELDSEGNEVIMPNPLTQTELAMEGGLSELTEIVQVMIFNPQYINRASLTQIAEHAAEKAIDLTLLPEVGMHKSEEQIVDFLTTLNTLMRETNRDNFETFKRAYQEFFDIQEVPSRKTISIGNKQTLFEMVTNRSEEAVMENSGMVHMGSNLYKKVDRLTSSQMATKTINGLVSGEEASTPFPPRAFTGNRADDGKHFDLKEYIMKSNSEEVVRDITANLSDYFISLGSNVTQRNIAYHKAVNKGLIDSISRLETSKETSKVPNKAYLSLDPKVIQNSRYYLDGYLSEFTKDKLREKLANSDIYKNFYRYIDVTDKGLRLNDNSPYTLRNMEAFSKELASEKFENLKNHLTLSGERVLSDIMDTEVGTKVLFEDNYREFAQRNPEDLKTTRGDYTETENGIKSKVFFDQIVKLEDGRLFNKTEDNGVEAIYETLERKTGLEPTEFKERTPLATNQEGAGPLTLNDSQVKVNDKIKKNLEC